MASRSIKSKRKLVLWIIGVLVALIIIVRLALPYVVTKYVNQVLSDIPGYWGSISDVDIALIRGAYVIQDLKLFKIDGNKRVPFIDIPEIDLSIEWSALFDGAVVGEVIFVTPSINFIGGDSKNSAGKTENQTGKNVDWTVPVKRLMPLQINRLEVIRGNIFFYDFTTKPQVDISLQQVNATATNLNNAERQQTPLPSRVYATATSIGKGLLTLQMDINVLKKIPDLDMDLKFEGVEMPALNDFFLAYAKVDIEKGSFNLYSEMTVNDGDLQGYVKPVAQGVQIVNWKKDNQNFFNLIWQSIVGLLVEIFENQNEDQFATKIELEGNLNNIETSTWPAIWNIFQNAFVKAFEKNTDDTVEFKEDKSSQKDARGQRDKNNDRNTNEEKSNNEDVKTNNEKITDEKKNE